MRKLVVLFFFFWLCLLPGVGFTEVNLNEREQIRESEFTAIAAAACAGSYTTEGQSAEASYLAEYGFTSQYYSVPDGKRVAHFLFAYNNGSYEDADFFILAFRGSVDKNDWLVNFNVDKVVYTGSTPEEFVSTAKVVDDKNIPAVHKGFNEYVNAGFSLSLDLARQASILEILDKIKNQPNTRLLLTGHSLGGAAATLCAERLVSMGIPKDKVSVITFGAPAIGNAAFADAYGDKINLLRITNPYDPVPGGLQTVFGGFKQFGREKRYDLSARVTENQHPIAYYFDYAVKDYYDNFDAAAATGAVNALPDKLVGNKGPTVAIYTFPAENKKYQPLIKYMQRFVIDEYRTIFPNYIFMTRDLNKNSAEKTGLGQLLERAAQAGADYVLFLEVDAKRLGQEDRWYISLNQSVFTDNGGLLLMSSYGKRLSHDQGFMQCTIANIEQARADLVQIFTWSYTRTERKQGG